MVLAQPSELWAEPRSAKPSPLPGRTNCLALGFGSLYNHSYRPNARYDDVGPQAKSFTALRDIAPGEEITVNYNGEPGRRKKVWFDLAEEARPRVINGASQGAG